ncbi:MAG: ABC transporter permease [candidate division Zixibacteria bacterium]
MNAIESIKLALQALWANKLRSGLTLFGVVIGVTSVITIISAVEGFMSSIEDSLSVLGPSTFIVTKFGMITTRDEYLDAMKRKDLTLKDRDAVEDGCLDCEAVAARAYRFRTIKRKNNSLNNVPIAGATANFMQVLDFEVGQGRSMTEMEYLHKRQVAFIGPTVQEELYPGEDPIGKVLKIGGRKFKVIGIALKRGSTMGNNQDNFVLIPLSTQIKLFGKPRHNLDILVKSTSVEKTVDTQDQVRSILRARRGVSYYDDDDFGLLTAESIMTFVNNITRILRFALIGISSIALVVGGIVIMNIMMVSVSERTREIGIRKSIGARRKNIMMQFLYESLILSLGGGIIGTALGITVAIILGSQISLPITPSLFAIIAGILISTGVGMFFGIYPAMKAAKLDPIKALSYE